MTMTRLFHTFIKIFQGVGRSKKTKFKNSALLRILSSSLQISTSNHTKSKIILHLHLNCGNCLSLQNTRKPVK